MIILLSIVYFKEWTSLLFDVYKVLLIIFLWLSLCRLYKDPSVNLHFQGIYNPSNPHPLQVVSDQRLMDRIFGSKQHEGQSTTRPPYFDGIGYNFCKQKMKIFLNSIDLEIWQIVEDGYIMPQTSRDQ